MDIIGAMNKEREYLSFRAKGEEPYHFVDAVKEYGFDSLKQYSEEKIKYVFSHTDFEIVNTTPDKAISEVFLAIQTKTNKIGFIDIDYTLVLSGNAADANVEYCAECNIPIYPYYTRGGSSVATAGDFLLGICMPKTDGVNEAAFLLEQICSIFRRYSDAVFESNGNDILMNGKKILGSARYAQNGMVVLINYLSFSDKKELIENICLKHSTKQPGYIDFMSRDAFRKEVIEWAEI